MLLTYFHRKFRKAAPSLVVLQLFAFLGLVVYQKYSERKMPNLEGYVWILEDTNQNRSNELQHDLSYFNYQISKEGRGEDFIKGANVIWEITSEYRKELDRFTVKMNDRVIFSDLTPEQKETVMLQFANDNKWNVEITELLIRFQTEMKAVARQMEQVIGLDYWKSVNEKGYFKQDVFDKIGLSQPFESFWQIELSLKMAENIVLNYAQNQIKSILGRVSFHTVIWDLNFVNVLPVSQSVHEGEVFEAEIALLQQAEFIPQTVRTDGKILESKPNGNSTYKVEAKEVGTHTIEASITTKNRTGETRTYTSQYEYTVLPKCN
ncbi:MAG: hypothetical protein R3E32_00490 [Chitinophagales bacterium]